MTSKRIFVTGGKFFVSFLKILNNYISRKIFPLPLKIFLIVEELYPHEIKIKKESGFSFLTPNF